MPLPAPACHCLCRAPLPRACCYWTGPRTTVTLPDTRIPAADTRALRHLVATCTRRCRYCHCTAAVWISSAARHYHAAAPPHCCYRTVLLPPARTVLHRRPCRFIHAPWFCRRLTIACLAWTCLPPRFTAPCLPAARSALQLLPSTTATPHTAGTTCPTLPGTARRLAHFGLRTLRALPARLPGLHHTHTRLLHLYHHRRGTATCLPAPTCRVSLPHRASFAPAAATAAFTPAVSPLARYHCTATSAALPLCRLWVLHLPPAWITFTCAAPPPAAPVLPADFRAPPPPAHSATARLHLPATAAPAHCHRLQHRADLGFCLCLPPPAILAWLTSACVPMPVRRLPLLWDHLPTLDLQTCLVVGHHPSALPAGTALRATRLGRRLPPFLLPATLLPVLPACHAAICAVAATGSCLACFTHYSVFYWFAGSTLHHPATITPVPPATCFTCARAAQRAPDAAHHIPPVLPVDTHRTCYAHNACR